VSAVTMSCQQVLSGAGGFGLLNEDESQLVKDPERQVQVRGAAELNHDLIGDGQAPSKYRIRIHRSALDRLLQPRDACQGLGRIVDAQNIQHH
jgi:hypothetical protein